MVSTLQFCVLCVTSQSFLFGYVFACINPCLVIGSAKNSQACYDGSNSCPPGSIFRDLDLSTFETSLITASMIAGAWVGSIFGSYPSERFGRRQTYLWNCLLFLAGGALGSTGYLYALLIGRFVSGLGVGIASALVPMLLSEISEPDNRGIITTMHQVMVTFAIFFVSLLGYGLVTYVDHGWQYIQGLQCVPAVVPLCFAAHIPESPKWLVAQLRRDEAYTVLSRIRKPDSNISEEVANIAMEIKSFDSIEEATWSELFRSHARAVVAGCGLMSLFALTGINTVSFYSSTIFGFAGVRDEILATTSVSAMNFLMTFVSANLVDRINRKQLLSRGCCLMAASLAMLSTVLYAGNTLSIQGILAVIAVLLYNCGFSIGLGGVVWVIIAELVPSRLQSKAMYLFLNTNWASNLVVGLITLPAINYLGGVKKNMDDDTLHSAEKNGVAYLYFIFFGMTTAAVLFIQICVPDSKKNNATTESDQPLLN